jgi:predicted HD phosphohydrolase
MASTATNFTSLANTTLEDWNVITGESRVFTADLYNRVMAHLRLLDGDFGGFPIDRLQHSLQTATRAHNDGRDEEYVVCALLHDIGDTLGSYNHPEIAAAILQPFVSEENYWMVKHHGIFQGKYFFQHLGMDPDMRDQFAGHPSFDCTAEFCEKYDAPAFDPNYETQPLSFFEPMLKRVFAKPRKTIYKILK